MGDTSCIRNSLLVLQKVATTWTVSKQAAGPPACLDNTPFCGRSKHLCILSSPLLRSVFVCLSLPSMAKTSRTFQMLYISCMFAEKGKASECHRYKMGIALKNKRFERNIKNVMNLPKSTSLDCKASIEFRARRIQHCSCS